MLINELFSPKNVNLVVGLLALLIASWLIMFVIPSIFVSIFNTILGNFILLGFVILVAMFNPIMAIGLAFVFLLLFRFSHMSSVIPSII
jgi:hypothetical protein